MTLALLTLWIAVTLCIVLAVLVFLASPRRTVNRQYLIFSLFVIGWMVSVGAALQSETAAQAARWVRAAFVFSSAIPTAVLLLRQAIVLRDAGWWVILRKSAVPALISTGIQPLFFAPFFLRSVRMTTTPEGAPFEVEYGWGFPVYAAYFVVLTLVVIGQCVRDVWRMRGIRRAELGYVLIGAASGMAVGATLALVLPLVRGTAGTSMYAPSSAILLNACIAYGIASRRILDVADVLRRGVALALLLVYLLLLYFGVWRLFAWALTVLVGEAYGVPQALAALAVAFALAPAHGQVQRLSRRMFRPADRAELSDLLRESSRSLYAVTTLDALLRRFSALIARALDAEPPTLLLRARAGFEPATDPIVLPSGSLSLDDPLALFLEQQRAPVSIDVLERGRSDARAAAAAASLYRLECRMAAGVYGKEGLFGILLLGPRFSGRIYDHYEQQAVQAMCDQLAIAIENARLYTEVESGRRYIETLLDRLPSGVIAVDADRRVTVMNREARRMIGPAATKVPERSLGELPAVLRDALTTVLDRGAPLADRELHLARADGESLPIHAGAATVPAPAGERPGALLVFDDLTRIRDLERRIQQKEEMAKIGMLAASLAHEIKNPLFTLKTFAHLLPTAYEDRDFRENFAPLVGQEVRRIDTIVNDLLGLARIQSAKSARQQPVRLHDLLDGTLELVRRRIGAAPIEVRRAWGAARDMILGDAEWLEKTFDHFYSNAIEAMPRGLLLVTTENVQQPFGEPDLWGRQSERPAIRVRVHDTGPGIPVADRPFVFEPFFTRKTGGTGLGLAVAHRHVTAHGGTLGIEDVPGYGAVLSVVLPLAPEEPAS